MNADEFIQVSCKLQHPTCMAQPLSSITK